MNRFGSSCQIIAHHVSRIGLITKALLAHIVEVVNLCHLVWPPSHQKGTIIFLSWSCPIFPVLQDLFWTVPAISRQEIIQVFKTLTWRIIGLVINRIDRVIWNGIGTIQRFTLIYHRPSFIEIIKATIKFNRCVLFHNTIFNIILLAIDSLQIWSYWFIIKTWLTWLDRLIRLRRLTWLNRFVWLIWLRYNGHIGCSSIWTCHRHIWLRRIWPCDDGHIGCCTAGRNRNVSVAVGIDTNSAISSACGNWWCCIGQYSRSCLFCHTWSRLSTCLPSYLSWCLTLWHLFSSLCLLATSLSLWRYCHFLTGNWTSLCLDSCLLADCTCRRLEACFVTYAGCCYCWHTCLSTSLLSNSCCRH